MPTLETIRRLKVEATTSGVAQTTAELNKLSTAQDGVAKSAERMDQKSKGGADTAERYRRQTLALDEAARKQDQYAKAARVADQALAQGVITQSQHAERLGDLSLKYGVASTASKAFAQATSGVNAALIGMSAGAGPVGVFLSGLGRWGLGAAVGIGVAVDALKAMSEAAHAVGQKAIELRNFSETTGLSTTQVQALRLEAVRFGVSSDQIESALQKFTTNFEELRFGGGNALKMLQRYRPDLVDAMQGMEDTADALGVLRKAFEGLGVSAQNALSKAFFGKGAAEVSQLFKAADINAITKAYAEAGRGLSEEQVKIISKLEIENQSLRKIVGESFAKMFAEDVLAAENSFLRGLIEINNLLKEILKNRHTLDALKYAIPAVGLAVDVVSAFDPKKADEEMTALLARQDELTKSMENYRKEGEAAAAVTGRWPAYLAIQMQQAGAELDKVNAKIGTMQLQQAKAPPAEASALPQFGPKTIEATIEDQKRLVAVLGTLASVEDIVALKENELTVARRAAKGVTDEQAASLMALARVQAEMAQVAPGTYERQLAALEALKAAFPGLTAAQAQVALSLNQQLVLAQAVTGQQKMMVQAGIDYQAAIDRGLTTEQASAEAAQKHAIAVAQVTAAAQAQLLALRDQYAVSAAVTGAEKMRAQATATTNALLRDGVDAYTAQAVAAQELKNAQAAATAAVEQSIHGLEQELEVLKTSTQEEENRVKARQAYQNAIDSGADVETSGRLYASTLAVSEEKRRQVELAVAQKAENEQLKEQDKERLRLCKEMAKAEEEYLASMERIYAGQAQLLDQMSFDVGAPGAAGSSTTSRGPDITVGHIGPWMDVPGKLGTRTPTPEDLASELEGYKKQGYTQAHIVGSGWDEYIEKGPIDQGFLTQQGTQPFEMSRVRAQISGDKGAELGAMQGELSFLQTRPETLENLQAIKSLMDAIKQLTDATQAQTATLSDIYGAGHAGRIGYYNEGTTTAVIGQPTITSNPPVWGNPMTTPPAANTNVPGGGYNRPANWSGGASGGWGARVAFSGTLPPWVNTSNVPRFAEGGTVTRPTLALVGEAGPEDITPVGKRTGQPTVVQNFNIMMPARSDLGDRSAQRQMFEGVGRRAAVTR